MKTLKYLFTCLLIGFMVKATSGQVKNPDQNPNYEKSLNKYMNKKDSILQYQGTTVHQTYKAFDWIQWKREQKDLKREMRHERRMTRANFYGSYYYDPYPYDFHYNYYDRYYYPYNYCNYSYIYDLHPWTGLGLLGLGIYSILR